MIFENVKHQLKCKLKLSFPLLVFSIYLPLFIVAGQIEQGEKEKCYEKNIISLQDVTKTKTNEH